MVPGTIQVLQLHALLLALWMVAEDRVPVLQFLYPLQILLLILVRHAKQFARAERIEVQNRKPFLLCS
jgi:branched-subunit amino acid permease